jgi:hypothetical protein
MPSSSPFVSFPRACIIPGRAERDRQSGSSRLSSGSSPSPRRVSSLRRSPTPSLSRHVHFHPFSRASTHQDAQLNFWSFLLIFVAGAVSVNYWIRSRYLNKYEKLVEPPLEKARPGAVHPDVETPDAPGGPPFANYLDEFLQAVRVFGFLEKPVRPRPPARAECG